MRVRLKGMRPGYDVDYEAVFQLGAKKAAEGDSAASSRSGEQPKTLNTARKLFKTEVACGRVVRQCKGTGSVVH